MDTNWKSAQINIWQDLGVAKFLSDIGVDFEQYFLKPLANFDGDYPYSNHKWRIIPHSLIENGVLHLYPLDASDKNSIWEEWFFYEGILRHHVLSQLPQKQVDGTWHGDITDMDHPKEVLEIDWFYYNDSDPTPLKYLKS